jgi:hypothetical protein
VDGNSFNRLKTKEINFFVFNHFAQKPGQFPQLFNRRAEIKRRLREILTLGFGQVCGLSASISSLKKQPDQGKQSMKQVVNRVRVSDGGFSDLAVANHE